MTLRRITLLCLLSLAIPLAGCKPQIGGPFYVRFEAFGVATADGKVAPGEWDKADCTQFPVNLPGGGTVTGDICLMNDAQNLYALLKYPRSVVDTFLIFTLTFSRLPAEGGAEIDEHLTQRQDLGSQGGPVIYHYEDAHPGPTGSRPDDADGGTRDGAGGLGTSGGMHIYEIAHPLDTADDKHDYSLTAGSVI